jgi:hypothetical protein
VELGLPRDGTAHATSTSTSSGTSTSTSSGTSTSTSTSSGNGSVDNQVANDPGGPRHISVTTVDGSAWLHYGVPNR